MMFQIFMAMKRGNLMFLIEWNTVGIISSIFFGILGLLYGFIADRFRRKSDIELANYKSQLSGKELINQKFFEEEVICIKELSKITYEYFVELIKALYDAISYKGDKINNKEEKLKHIERAELLNSMMYDFSEKLSANSAFIPPDIYLLFLDFFQDCDEQKELFSSFVVKGDKAFLPENNKKIDNLESKRNYILLRYRDKYIETKEK